MRLFPRKQARRNPLPLRTGKPGPLEGAAGWALAALSVGWALWGALGDGIDLGYRQREARAFLQGDCAWDRSANWASYPPFAQPLLAPLGLAPFPLLRLLGIAGNLGLTVAVLRLAAGLWGAGLAPRWRFWLGVGFVSTACWRVNLRNGQMSLLLLFLVLLAVRAFRSRRDRLAGVWLGVSLLKYTLTGPFLVLAVRWRSTASVLVAAAAPVGLTLVYCLRMGMSPWDAVFRYADCLSKAGVYSGTYELVSLFAPFFPSHSPWPLALTAPLAAIALGFVWREARRPSEDDLPLISLTATATLWLSYHRVYDGVIVLIPAYLFSRWTQDPARRRAGWLGLGGLGLVALNLSGAFAAFLGPRLPCSLAFLATNADRFWALGLFALLARSAACSSPAARSRAAAEGSGDGD